MHFKTKEEVYRAKQKEMLSSKIDLTVYISLICICRTKVHFKTFLTCLISLFLHSFFTGSYPVFVLHFDF